ncbi:MAG: 3-methylornithine--L-lysine ligase PylC [Bacillota bacterium]
MHVAVIGGKLQGLEAVYLAKKAGWKVVLIDKKLNVPAAAICDKFCQADANNEKELVPELYNADLIVPALENRQVLHNLVKVSEKLMIPLVFDLQAYHISSSKISSDQLFAEIDIPAPVPWPECALPIIAKPSGSSGSEGVLHLEDASELKLFQEKMGTGIKDWVLQEYLDGPSYSLEVIGWDGKYIPLQLTGLEFDPYYDCKRVRAPVKLDMIQEKQLADIAIKIAQKVNLKGIMDVEVILHRDQLKVLEIDARLPSQTPTAVYHSTGLNMLELIGNIFLTKSVPEVSPAHSQKAVIYEHIIVEDDKLVIAGEHIISTAGPLFYTEGFFGADEALTTYTPGKKTWIATLINTGSTKKLAEQKREAVINNILREMRINSYEDLQPVACSYTARKE